MLCLICNDEVFQGYKLKCSIYNKFPHFTCSGYREVNFRKSSKPTKAVWCCLSCKIKKTPNSIDNSSSVVKKKTEILVKTLKIIIELVNFMSSQFDSFGKQLSELILLVMALKN
ncbi:hypothetical protein QTP88_000292 [Uroleucon formosanum]